MQGTMKQGKNGLREWHQQNATDPTKTIVFVESSNGTFFHKDTPTEVKNILNKAIDSPFQRSIRLFLDTGSSETGQSWGEVYDVQGTIGRSTGTVKIPLLIKTKRSTEGGAILDNCIVRIKHTGKDGKTLYKHPSYKAPKVEFDRQAKLYSDVL